MAEEQGKQKILIVEDYAVLARMYQNRFREDGFEVEVALDGAEGERLIREFKPALVLLDVMLPKKNGLEILEGVKRDPQTAGISVILLTNLGGPPETIARALELGADSYLVKANYTPKQVIEEVKKVLKKEKPQIPTLPPRAEAEETAPAPQPAPVGVAKAMDNIREDQREAAREDLRKAATLLEMAQRQANEAAKRLSELDEAERKPPA